MGKDNITPVEKQAERDEVICPQSPSRSVARLGIECCRLRLAEELWLVRSSLSSPTLLILLISVAG